VNVEGTCPIEHCEAYQQLVIDPKGLVALDLLTDKPHCPCCHTSIVANACGSTSCMWALDGCRETRNGPEKSSHDWRVCLHTIRMDTVNIYVPWNIGVITPFAAMQVCVCGPKDPDTKCLTTDATVPVAQGFLITLEASLET